MQFEVLHRELQDSAEIIRALVTGVTLEEARLKPDPESCSILEVVCHLYDEEREDFRPRLDIILHRPAESWAPIDPQGWVTSRNYNERNLAEALESFLAERKKSLAWLQSLSTSNWDAEFRNQSRSIKAGDMFAAWVAHDNLHIRQLVELRRVRLVNLVEPFDVSYAGEW
jgi:DinB superfamily